MCGGGGGVVHAVTSAVAAPVRTVTTSVASAVSDVAHGNVVGAASSLGNAVNPVALSQAAATGQSTSNSSQTLSALQGDAQKAVGAASIYTGLSPQQLESAGLAYATGGVSTLPDLAYDYGTGLLNPSSQPKALPTTRATGAGPVGVMGSPSSTGPILLAGALAVGVYLYARR